MQSRSFELGSVHFMTDVNVPETSGQLKTVSLK